MARRILQFLESNYGEEFNSKQITKKLEIRDSLLKGGVDPILQQLVESGAVSRNSRNYFSSTKDPSFITGTVDFVNPRFAFIVPDNPEVADGDILVKEADLKQALDGDKVRVMLFPLKGKTGRTEGRVLEIIERNRDEFVGRVEISPRFAFVVPDFKKMHKDIFVHRGDLMGAEHNEKVIVKLTEWREDDKNPTGKVIRVLGKAGLHEVEIHSIMQNLDFPLNIHKSLMPKPMRFQIKSPTRKSKLEKTSEASPPSLSIRRMPRILMMRSPIGNWKTETWKSVSTSPM